MNKEEMPRVLKIFEKANFVYRNADDVNIFGVKEDHFYAAPSEGIHNLNEKSCEDLSDRVMEIFKDLAVDFRGHDEKSNWTKKEVMRHFIEYYELPNDCMSSAFFASKTSDLYYRRGAIDKECGYFVLPKLYWGKSSKQKGQQEVHIYPCIEFIDLYLNHLNKVKEVYRSKEGFFEYKSLSTSKKIKIPLKPVKEKLTFMPITEMMDSSKSKTGSCTYGLPFNKREVILRLISNYDIPYFGGCYNWTTGWRGERVYIKEFNAFFQKINT